MEENTEGRLKRAMDRLFPSPPPKPQHPHSIMGSDKKGVNMGTNFFSPIPIKKETSPRLSEIGHLNTNSNPGLHRICRPWDRADLFRRLATFKSMTWFGKPELANPVSCARKGWVNVDVDLIACESCNAMLSFPIPLTWSQHEAEKASVSFSEKLDSGHKALCPWKENACSETLAQFPPTSIEVLAESFKDRCKELSQLPALPVISDSAIQYLKNLKGPQIDRLLLQSATDFVVSNRIPDDTSGNSSLYTYINAQKVISLCGWQPRLLPFVVDYVDDNTGFSVSESISKQQKSSDLEGHILITPPTKERMREKRETSRRILHGKSKLETGSGVLDCSLCGASVGLWLFRLVAVPSNVLQNAIDTAPGNSAASGIEWGSSNGQEGKEKTEIPENAGVDSVTSVEKPVNVVNLRLTIAGGPPPTRLSQNSQHGVESQTSKYALQPCYTPQNNISTSTDKDFTPVNKRKREERAAGENNLSKVRILPCLSSVDGVDTCFLHSRQENSAESVEMPHNACRDTITSGVDSDLITQRNMSGTINNPTSTDKLGTFVDLSHFENDEIKTGTAQELNDSDAGFEDGGKKSGKFVFEDKIIETCSPLEYETRKLWKEDMEFDPILQHRHFCPWVNTNVGRGLCGWQLTLDALEASPSLAKSESASSMYNADPLSSVRNILGKSRTSPKVIKK